MLSIGGGWIGVELIGEGRIYELAESTRLTRI